jgi:BirA family transcriptional regulator, biotin operon repressor / biotin---[acetyl-CoA-carboxylase] ligase
LYKIPANTLLLGKNIVFVPECHSTNNYALELTQNAKTPEGTIVITSNQKAGRGQRGNTWEAEPGMNLTFSLILKPKILVMDQFYLNMFTSLAIRDYIKEKSDALVQIKWPNDVLIDGKKACGILIENQIMGNRFSNCVVGIGLNINQRDFTTSQATSLSRVTNTEYALDVELQLLITHLEVRYFQLEQHQHQKLLDDYLSAMYWRNENHLFSAHEIDFNGMITGIDKQGRLEIETDHIKKYFGVKEVVYKA